MEKLVEPVGRELAPEAVPVEDAGFEAVPDALDAVPEAELADDAEVEVPEAEDETEDEGLAPGVLPVVLRPAELPAVPVPVTPGFADAAEDPEGGTDVVPEEVAELPGRGDFPDPAWEDPPGEAAPGFGLTFSAARSIVTGRLDAPGDADVVSGLPGDPLPPEEDVPPEDFLSVVICTSPEPAPAPEPSAPRPLLYTPLCEAVLPRQRLFRAAIEGLPRIWLTLR
ncbi:hypothetical protein DCO57_11850 [Labrenzia sp. 011]|nr:hypothetical protein DCO57_11850 [Labrenzia sp. 011]